MMKKIGLPQNQKFGRNKSKIPSNIIYLSHITSNNKRRNMEELKAQNILNLYRENNLLDEVSVHDINQYKGMADDIGNGNNKKGWPVIDAAIAEGK